MYFGVFKMHLSTAAIMQKTSCLQYLCVLVKEDNRYLPPQDIYLVFGQLFLVSNEPSGIFVIDSTNRCFNEH